MYNLTTIYDLTKDIRSLKNSLGHACTSARKELDALSDQVNELRNDLSGPTPLELADDVRALNSRLTSLELLVQRIAEHLNPFPPAAPVHHQQAS